MNIPLPCKLGSMADCNRKQLQLIGVSWFLWSSGMEYTYYFKNSTEFYTSTDSKQPFHFEISDSLLKDIPIKEHGFPLRGRGHVMGIDYKDGKIYVEFIITSNYFEHIRVECDSKGIYVPGGNIIFPPGWDTEKTERAILKSFISKKRCTAINSPMLGQLSLFELYDLVENGNGKETERKQDKC